MVLRLWGLLELDGFTGLGFIGFGVAGIFGFLGLGK